ncbi:MAG: ankyrin repeat domain-containing protein [Acidobacteriota bacterium]
MKVIPSVLLVLVTVVSGSMQLLASDSSTPPGPREQALMEAAFNGDLAAVRDLVSAGADFHAGDADRRTALMWAAFNGHTEVVAFLLDKDAALDAKDSNGRTALMYASSGPFTETVELQLKEGSEVNLQGTLEGFTALMTAAAEGQLEVVRVLLENGADPKLMDKDGDTAMTFARQNGHDAVVDLLVNPPAAKPDR